MYLEHFYALITFMGLDGLDEDVFRRCNVVSPREIVFAETDVRRGGRDALEAVSGSQNVTLSYQSSSAHHLQVFNYNHVSIY
jgi:hypothetical protein